MKNKKIVLLCIVILVVTVATIFLPVLLSHKSLWGPDNLPYGSVMQKAQLPSSVCGRWSEITCGYGRTPYWLVPGAVLLFFLPPLLVHVLAYILDVTLLILAMIYLLRGLKVKGAPLYIASLAMGLSYHSFTIIAAGHLGKFHMMPMGVFMLAFFDRAIKQRSLFYFALTGMAAGFGLAAQADVMFVFVLLGGAYGLYRFVTEWSNENRFRYSLLIAIGIAIAGVMFLSVSAVSLKSLTSHTLGKRAEKSGNTPEQKWEFATNWSLPPEDLLEFIAPCIRGIQTGEPAGPYWGRLGQTKGWMQTHQGLRNLRQHTVYVGVLQLIFALFALWMVFGKQIYAGNDDENDVLAARQRKYDVIFFSVVFVLAVMMALGRYFPLYRLFYMLPYASSMRAPVKFMHVVEVSLAVLFAFGLEGFFNLINTQSDDSKKKSFTNKIFIRFAIGSGIVGLVLFLYALYIGGHPENYSQHWQAMGFGNITDLLFDNMSAGLVHGALLFFFGSGLFFCAVKCRGQKWLLVWGPIIIMIVLAFDLVSVDKKYVVTKDLSAFFDDNVLIDKLKSDKKLYRLSCPVNQQPFMAWKTFMFQRHLIDCLEPAGNMPKDYISYFAALQNNIVRLWQLTNSRYILGPTQWTEQLTKNPAFRKVLSFNMDSRGGIIPADFRGGQFTLVEFMGALPRAAVYYNWRKVPANETINALTDKKWNPATTLLVTADIANSSGHGNPTPVTYIKHKPQRVEIEVEAKESGILLVNDRYDPDWRVFVDGKEKDVLICNAIMRGVKVSAGKHKIVFVYHPYLKQFIISMIALLIIAVWAIVRRFRPSRFRLRNPTA